MSYKPLLKSRQVDLKKSARSPFSRSIYELDSPPHSHAAKIQITPQRHIKPMELGSTKPKERIQSNLNSKIDSIIKQNGSLLQQNNKLNDLVRLKDESIHDLQRKLQHQLQQQQRGLLMIQQQKNRILLDIRTELSLKDKQISELRILAQQLQIRQQAFKVGISKLKEQMLKDSQQKIDAMKQAQLYNIGIYQTQFTKLKQSLSNKQQQLQKQQHIHNMKQQRYEQQIRTLDSELKHLQQQKIVEQQQNKLKHENQIAQLVRDNLHKRQVQNRNYQTIIKRIRSELSEKILENERLMTRIEITANQNVFQYNDVQQQKIKIECELQQMQLRNKELLLEERTKLQEMAEAELSSLKLCHEHLISSLQSENKKLMEISDLKTQEIKRLKKEMAHLKQQRNAFSESDNNLIKHLQNRLKQLQISNQQQTQLFKVKVSQLHNGDIRALVNSYEQQIESLSELVTKLEQVIKDNRDKIHKQLLKKGEMRKEFQIELAKQYTQNIELKTRLETKHLEMKSSLENIRSKNQITSETALRQRSSNRKDIQKREADIKKLHELIQAKDNEIQQLNDIIDKLKNDFSEQLKQKSSQISRLKNINQSLQNQQRKQKQFYEKQLKKKDSQHKDQRYQLEEQLSNLKKQTYQQLMSELHEVQQQKLRLESELSKQRLQKQSITSQQKIQKQLVEAIKIESQIALQQEKESNIKKKDLAETGFKKLYGDQIKSRQIEINQLKRRIFEKDSDVRDFENKANDFETRLNLITDGQSRLRQFESRVINLGMDNNLIKARAELFRLQK